MAYTLTGVRGNDDDDILITTAKKKMINEIYAQFDLLSTELKPFELGDKVCKLCLQD